MCGLSSSFSSSLSGQLFSSNALKEEELFHAMRAKKKQSAPLRSPCVKPRRRDPLFLLFHFHSAVWQWWHWNCCCCCCCYCSYNEIFFQHSFQQHFFDVRIPQKVKLKMKVYFSTFPWNLFFCRWKCCFFCPRQELLYFFPHYYISFHVCPSGWLGESEWENGPVRVGGGGGWKVENWKRRSATFCC